MSGWRKLGLVLGGYMAAVAFASLGYIVLSFAAPPDPSAMRGFGDMLLVLGLFGFAAILPTALGMYFLRRFHWFWNALAAAVLAVALATLTGVGLAPHPTSGAWSMLSFVGLMLVFATPVVCLGCLAAAALTPYRRPRKVLLVAAAIEAATGAYAFLCLFILGHWLV
jgi:hypothetical protein